MTKYRLFIFLCIFLVTAAWSYGSCAEVVTLRIADSFPAGHVFHKVLTIPFMEEVEKESNGQIKFQHYPGEQIGKAKDMLTLTQTGVVDIGSVMPDYVSDRMPLSAAFELPGIFPDYCQGVRAFWKVTHNGGYLEKNEFVPNKIVPIINFMLPTYQIIVSSREKLDSIKEFAGLKVRSAGGAMDFVLYNLNMVPVHMTPPEVYESMSRGTIDAAVLPYNSAKSYKLIPLLKSGTVGANFGTVVSSYSMTESKWKQLPENVRAILMKVGYEVSMAACAKFIAEENSALMEAKKNDVKEIKFSAVDEKVLSIAFEKAAQEWATSLDKRNKHGSETLAAVRKAIAESKQ